MAEVDLIPSEFRSRQRLRRLLSAGLRGYIVLVLLLLGAKLWLGGALQGEKNRIAALKAEESVILQQRQRYDELQGERQRLGEYLAILQSLRGGPRAEELFVAIDQAINPEVWITSWKFLRGGESAAATPARSNPGALNLLAKGETASEEQWRHEPRMELSGQALSHSALAGFVNTLQEQREIAEVKLQSTVEKPYLSGRAIFYQMTVRVNSAAEGERGQSL